MLLSHFAGRKFTLFPEHLQRPLHTICIQKSACDRSFSPIVGDSETATFSVLAEAYAQAPDTTSTVVGRKLSFEVPIIWITQRALKPTWSIVTFDEISGGFNYLMGVPGQMKPFGWYGDFLTLTMRHPSCARTRAREATIPARGGFSPAEALCKAFLSVYPRSVT